MSEYINNVSKRKETIIKILKQLNEGRSIDDVKEEFSGLLDDVDAPSIAEVEQMLIEEGTPVDEIQRLCDVHTTFFRETLDAQELPENQPSHPLHTYKLENIELIKHLDLIQVEFRSLKEKQTNPSSDEMIRALESVKKFDLHYIRKENILFPYLEKYSFYGPSQVMWGIHNDIRKEWKELETTLAIFKGNEMNMNFSLVEQKINHIDTAMREMVYKEEKILFPAALERLTKEDWNAIRIQDFEVGFSFIQPPLKPGSVPVVEDRNDTGDQRAEIERSVANTVSLNTGALTSDQLDLLLRTLPVDVTFVDEKDEVRFFSQTKERVFQRSPAIIGRKVQNCHPPQSIHVVQQIVDDFKTGKRDVAEFWLELGGKFILIQYFALHDEFGKYKGVIEVSQDATHIRSLTGEKRLLDEK